MVLVTMQERIDARIMKWEADKKRVAEEWAAKEQADIEEWVLQRLPAL